MDYLMGIICSWLVWLKKKPTTTTLSSLFFFSFLNKAKICQPNRNWQHSFKQQNKAHPSWALTRLLYLCLTCWAHVQFSFPWSEQACCTVSALVPLAHLSFFSASCSCHPCAPVECSWSKPPAAAQTPALASAPSSDKAQAHPSPGPPELQAKAGNCHSPFQKCILEKTYRLYRGFPKQSFLTLGGMRNWKIYNTTKKHFQLYSDSISSSFRDILGMRLPSILAHKQETRLLFSFQ